MKKIPNIISKCFEEENNIYLNPQIMIAILNKYLEREFEEEKNFISKIHVFDLKEAIEISSRIHSLTPEEIEEEKYLKYLKNYISILQNKCLLLLEIIDKIAKKDTNSIKEYITTLDIKLDENNNIYYKDIKRLIVPTLYNIKCLHQKLNDLEMRKINILEKNNHHGMNNIYPDSSLQLNRLDCPNRAGYIPLSTKQIRQLKEQNQRIATIKQTGYIKDLLEKLATSSANKNKSLKKATK